MRQPRFCSIVGLVVVATAISASGQRSVAVVLDTSGSMEKNDPERYTVQLSQIIGDLGDQGDDLTVIRMPEQGTCSDQASSSLALRLDPSQRYSFKRALRRVIRYDGGTLFAAPIRTAISALSGSGEGSRMFLIIADSGGLGSCGRALNRELLGLERSGVLIAAINLGSSSGAFDSNSAFNLTASAQNAEQLIAAVAKIYQRFLGAKKVQTGEVGGQQVRVEISPLVASAYLVVAADGRITGLTQGAGNPGAASCDLNYRGGGETVGLDGRTRGYRIVRIERPAAGRWTFQTPGMHDTGGWMLLQDFRIGARIVKPRMIDGAPGLLTVELYDEETGERISASSLLPGLQVTIELDGSKHLLGDDGAGGDQQAGDGIYSTTVTPQGEGTGQVSIEVTSDLLDQRFSAQIEVAGGGWILDIKTTDRTVVDRELELVVELRPESAAKVAPPQRFEVLTGGPVIELKPGPGTGDSAPLIYRGVWTPTELGTVNLDYVALGGEIPLRASGVVEILGYLVFADPIPVDFGSVRGGSQPSGVLDLGMTAIRGTFTAHVSTDLSLERVVPEIDPGTGWVALGEHRVDLELTSQGTHKWPLRLRVATCAQANPANQSFSLLVEVSGAVEQPLRHEVPLRVQVIADTWLRCWWPLLAAVISLLVIAIVIHGFVSPARFQRRIGVVLSPEEDMNEGFFHPILAQRGSRSGFYRDARVYLGQDFRISSSGVGAVARLRAHGNSVMIQPGDTVLRLTADEQWERLSPAETNMRFGVVYKNELGTLYFELRNG